MSEDVGVEDGFRQICKTSRESGGVLHTQGIFSERRSELPKALLVRGRSCVAEAAAASTNSAILKNSPAKVHSCQSQVTPACRPVASWKMSMTRSIKIPYSTSGGRPPLFLSKFSVTDRANEEKAVVPAIGFAIEPV
jgi:hypothetical protein